jgi:DNA-binding MarR family transcriptional regulator
MSPNHPFHEKPLGRLFAVMSKQYLNLLRDKLSFLDIDRNYQTLALITLHKGKLTQQELTIMLDTDKVTIVRMIDYLAIKGYVERLRQLDDKRKFDLIPTQKAVEALPHILQAFEEINRLALNGIPPNEIEILSKNITLITKNLSQNTL